MKLFSIKKGRYWGVYVFDKPLVVKLIFCNMRCEKISNTVEIPDDITIVPIDGELLERIKKMKYRVKQFFNEDRDSFYGMVALVGDVPCGYVCGRKEYKNSEKKSDKPDLYYIKYVYVDPNYRGRRISAMVISEAAKNVNCPLYLNCRENNAPALKVYRSLGFETVSIHEKVQIPITHRGISTKKYRI